MLRGLVAAFGLTCCIACGTPSTTANEPMPKGALSASEFWAAYAEDPDMRTYVDTLLEVDGRSLEPSAWCTHALPSLSLDASRSVATRASFSHLAKTGSVDVSPFVVTASHWVTMAPKHASATHGPHLTILATWNESADESRVVFVWSGTDGTLIDAATLQTVLVKRSSRFTGLAFDRANARLYICDIKNFEVLRMDDTDSDSVPDRLARKPAVAYPDFHARLSPFRLPAKIKYLKWKGRAGLLAGTDQLPEFVNPLEPYLEGHDYWIDSNEDGAIDEVTTWRVSDRFRIEPRGVFVGATVISVDQAIGSTINVHAVSGASPRVQVGELLARVEATKRSQDVTLRRALTAQDSIALLDASAKVRTRNAVVAAPLPRIKSYIPRTVRPWTRTIVVKGDRLRPDIYARFVGGSMNPPDPTVTWINAGEIHVHFEQIVDAELLHRTLSLRLMNPGSTSPISVPLIIGGD